MQKNNLIQSLLFEVFFPNKNSYKRIHYLSVNYIVCKRSSFFNNHLKKNPLSRERDIITKKRNVFAYNRRRLHRREEPVQYNKKATLTSNITLTCTLFLWLDNLTLQRNIIIYNAWDHGQF